jgi:DNA-binding GntR family transcriptional regulator
MLFFRISAAARGPLYRNVSEQLMAAVGDGRLSPGHALPGEHALCEQFGVSRITVRRALDDLVQRGVLERRRGVGTFVSPESSGAWRVQLTGVLEDVLTPSDHEIVAEATREPPAEVLRFARLAPGTRLKVYEAVNRVGGAPLVHISYYFPPDIAQHLSAEKLKGPSLVVNTVERALGCQFDFAEQVVEPMIASKAIARTLGISAGAAVLRAIRAYYDTTGRLIEILDAAYHPENYRYTATLYPRTRPKPN